MSDQTQLMTKRPAPCSRMARLAALLREFGPYLAIELILPGGSLIALLLWLCRRHAIPTAVTFIPSRSVMRMRR